MWNIKKRISRHFRWTLHYLLWQGKSMKWLDYQSGWGFWFCFIWCIGRIWHVFMQFPCQMKVELLEGGTFWLSESPSVPGSISWGAAVPCIATWAISFQPLALSILLCYLPCSFIFIWTLESVPCIVFLTWCHTFQLKGVEPPGFSFQIVNTNMDEFSPRARRRSALLTWQHIASLPPSLPVVYCGGFNTQKESTTGRFLLGRSRSEDACLFSVVIFL